MNDRESERELFRRKVTQSSSSSSGRIRSASASGRSKDDDLKCRYWAFLFDNLHRAVDEIYQNCERDESIVESKETILVLDNYTREFQALIQWINLTRDFDSKPQRPSSLAWEVRKSLPVNVFWNNYYGKHIKQKDNEKECDKQTIVVDVSDEKVKECPNVVVPNSTDEQKVATKGKRVKDDDGWELVMRGRQRYKNSPPKVIIFDENDEMIKTDADGTVTSIASQTNFNACDGELMRTPGRALEVHEKLSSRRRSLTDAIRKSEEKLARATMARERHLQKKAQNFKGIVKKVEEMKVKKEEQQMLLKMSMQRKLKRAEEKRKQQLNMIVRKAHDEESKVIEIQFINTLEAQNKRHDILSKEKDHCVRMENLHEERVKRHEEKAAKEAAAEERRKVIEEERQSRLLEMCERRKAKEAKLEAQLQEKEKERIDMRREKWALRKKRISAINAQHQANVEELQKKIMLKQEETKRRHESKMEMIRQKALELSVKRSAIGDDAPKCAPYDTKKMCSLCSVMIGSEVFLFGHLRGKKHRLAVKEANGRRTPSAEELDNLNLTHIVDAVCNESVENSERLKSCKKRCKKLRLKLLTQSQDETIQMKVTPRITKLVKDLTTLSMDNQITGQWPSNMIHSAERIVNELQKISVNHECISALCKLLSRVLLGTRERPPSLPDRVNAKVCAVILDACKQSESNCHYLMRSRYIVILLDILLHRCSLMDTSVMNESSNSMEMIPDAVIGGVCRVMSAVFDSLHDNQLLLRSEDVISLTVSSGLMDTLSSIMSNMRGPIDDARETALFLRNILQWMSSMTRIVMTFPNDSTQFVITLQFTQMAGVVSLVYGVLLHSGAPQRSDTAPPPLPEHTINVLIEAIRFCNYVSLIDLNMFQTILGGEGLSLQLRHICSYLLWYCSMQKNVSALLHEVILLIGNFVVLNNDNQSVIHSGQRPTILQQLCSLPFEYFSQLSSILFPTLIASCFGNDDNCGVLKQEMSMLMLVTFIDDTIVSLQLKAIDERYEKESKVNDRWCLSQRFPKNKWNNAKNYFDSKL